MTMPPWMENILIISLLIAALAAEQNLYQPPMQVVTEIHEEKGQDDE